MTYGAYLLDIEGTTTPVDFVYKTLFPFARRALPEFLESSLRDPAQKAALEADAALAPGSPAWTPLRDQGIAATRQLAKRQLTWLRSMPRTVVACDAPDATAQGLAAIGALLHRAAAA